MTSRSYVPHIDLLLQSLRITRERLNSKSRIAIDTELLRALLQALVRSQPFSPQFYAETYPDLAEGLAEGRIPNARRHMIDSGYFEGRMGAPPKIDEDFYLALYPDIAAAIERGEIASAAEHYVRAGAAEGRIPHPAMQDEINHWNRILRSDRAQDGAGPDQPRTAR